MPNSAPNNAPCVAVVGAGLAGLSAARILSASGVRVTVFEKSRAAGGRAATRRRDGSQFDHGAQYFTQRDPRTWPQLRAWVDRGVVAPWPARIASRDAGVWRESRDTEPRWVALPGMRALGVDLAQTLEVRYDTAVHALVRSHRTWQLLDREHTSLGHFDTVLVTAPAPQTHALLAPHAPSFAAALASVEFLPCIATMVVLERRPAVLWDAAFINDSAVLSWVARNASKPGRDATECWVLHATPTWSSAQLELDAASLAPLMVEAFTTVIGESVPVRHVAGHRWRYAIPANRAGLPDGEALHDPDLGLAAAGDWCVGGRVEGALLSGAAAATGILQALLPQRRPSPSE